MQYREGFEQRLLKIKFDILWPMMGTLKVSKKAICVQMEVRTPLRNARCAFTPVIRGANI